MDVLEKLLAMEEIRTTKAKRCLALDSKDWDTYRDCHTRDARSYVLGPGGAPIVGNQAITDSVRAATEGKTTIHLVSMPLFDFLSDTSAEVVWTLEDRLWWEEDGVPYSTHGFGHYHETYRAIDGRWLIATRRLVRSRVETQTGERAREDAVRRTGG